MMPGLPQTQTYDATFPIRWALALRGDEEDKKSNPSQWEPGNNNMH